MQIAYVGNFTQRHCTEVHLAATLESMGHDVVRIQETEQANPGWIERELPLEADLFLYTRTWGHMVTMSDIEQLRRLNIPSASYHLDLYVGLKREDGLDNDPFWRTDYVFTPDGSEEAAEVFKKKDINHFYMKPGVFKPECYSMASDVKYGVQFPLDVIFVGGGSATGEGPQYGHTEWPYRGQLIKWLKDTYGDQFKKFGWPQETIRNERLNSLYGAAKVVVGDTLCLGFTRPHYWSDRVYETMGRGGFMIHPYIKGMEEEFTDGENIVFYEYNNWAQLKEKIDYYLSHDDEREHIRQAGHEFVKENATYNNRLQLMLDTVFPASTSAAAVPTPSAADPGALKISLGAGTEPEEGFINVDIVPLEGIQVVHNLMLYPWPFEASAAGYIKAKDIIEHMATHLPDGRNSLIAFIEECHRILQPGGTLWIQTPAYDAPFLWIDPTHVRGYALESFDFFDPDTDFGRSTGFYSEAKFKVSATRLDNGNLQFELVKR